MGNQCCPVPFLVNFGGDLRASRPLPHGPWKVGIERPDAVHTAAMMLEVEYGALATSGDSHRFLLKEGVRFGHVLDPRTGWPVPDAPRSVTVAASSCTEAGLIPIPGPQRPRDQRAFGATRPVSADGGSESSNMTREWYCNSPAMPGRCSTKPACCRSVRYGLIEPGENCNSRAS